MRDLSATKLESAQKDDTIDAIYKVVLTKGASTYTYEEDRILPSKHDEEPYSHRATIVLDNSDGEFDSKDLKGYSGVISYGMVTSAGKEYSATAPVLVIDQQYNSLSGKLTCDLELEGIPNLMAQDEASENYIPDESDTETIKTLVNAIAGATLDCFNHCHAYEVVWDTGYDSLADTYKPKDSFRIYTRGSRLASLRRVLDYTANVARFEADGKIHILKPVTTGTTYDYEYNLESGHTIFSKAYRNSLVFPNKIVVKSNVGDDPSYSGSAQVDGYASLPDEVKKTTYILTRLQSNSEADNMATALITKAEMWSKRGAAEVPINVGSEVFDYVKVTDQRQGDSRTGNLGYIHRRFGEGKWAMTFGFGDWLEVLHYRKIQKGLETYTDAGAYFERLTVGTLYVGDIYLDDIFDGVNYVRVKSVAINAEGMVILDQVIEGTYAKVKKASLTAEGLVLLDQASGDIDDIGDGSTYQRVKSAALSASGLVLLDQVVTDTYGLVLATDISAGHIKLDEVVEGTYGLVKSTDIQSGHIKLTTVVGDLDDIDNGSTYGKVRQTDISSGHINLTSSFRIDGQTQSTVGVFIDATNGITIKGGKLKLQDSNGANSGILYIDTDGDLRLDTWNVQLGKTGGFVSISAADKIYLPTKSSAPSYPSKGCLFFNTSTNHLQYWQGTKWVRAVELDV